MTETARRAAAHVTIITAGSTGDIQPYVALGLGLARAGHEVRIATHGGLERLVRDRGLAFTALPGDARQTVESDAGQAWIDTGTDMLGFLRQMRGLMQPFMEASVEPCLEACRGADLVLYSMLGWFAAHHVTEKLGVPTVAAYLQPVTPTRAFHMSVARPARFGSGLNHLSRYLVGEEVLWQLFRRPINHMRRDLLDLAPMGWRAPFAAIRRVGAPVLYGYSPSLLPSPSDWPANVHVTGYWSLGRDPAWEAPPALLKFLEAGPPPVYVGFGSMHARHAREHTRLVVDALARSGQRGVLLIGWGALTDVNLPTHVFAVRSVPHDWLFPRMAAVVHHCGAGTTGAGIAAGVPTVPVPFFADQPFWAWRLHEAGVAPRPIPIKRLSEDKLADAISFAVEDEAVRRRAAELGERVRAEDGVGRAVEVLGQYVART